jgi:pyruvate carboxylase
VVSLFKGELGFPPDGFPPEISRRVLGAEPPAPYRPGDRIAAVDLDAARVQAQAECEQALDDPQLASWLMYPKVARAFHEHQRLNGDTSVLPTAAFFYPQAPGEEMAIEIDPGKTLLVSLQAVAPDAQEGSYKVQYELNGQPRTVRLEKRVAAGAGGARGAAARETADATNPAHVAAPMPGTVVTLAVTVGQRVQAGDTLLSLEAMKMETHIAAERSGTVLAIHAARGEMVKAKDLLIVLKLDE